MQTSSEPTVRFSLTVKDTAAALVFYKQAFDADELFRRPSPDGGVAPAEFMIGITQTCISDGYPDYQAFAIQEGANASCLFSIQVNDCDTACNRSMAAGAATLSEPADRFWGTRSAVI
jgi:PhnB protein